MFFNIKIDETLTGYLADKKIRLEELFVIVCFNLNRMDALKSYLSGRNGDQLIAYFQPLERKQLLRKITLLEDFDWDNYELTNLADEIFDDCNANVFEGDVSAYIPSVVATPKDMNKDELLALTEEFISLFPEGVRNRGGEYVRGNSVDVLKKMSAFIKKYKYNGETVIKATKKYLSEVRKDGYAYCNAAHYFISKNGISKLATECESVEKGVEKPGDLWENKM